ncbi:MAG TPA: nitroreductase family protein, partial [Syntrophomonadaceae bacterium]|nr:nitroreductase family protein [Syntrophomonadaceae bacterium]
MDTMEALFTRRSIRRYTGEPVPEDVIKKLL